MDGLAVTDTQKPLIELCVEGIDGLLAAQAAGADGRARKITSDFPAPDLARLGEVGGHHRVHDPRSAS